MQYAQVNNIKSVPIKGLRGICSGCGKDVVAKCGNIKIHHWAHSSRKECDNWWEPETEWHRDWKNMFPMEYREVIFTDPASNEIHRADIHTKNGITIEFQNSLISTQELKSREGFYNKLIWVINGQKFKGGFEFTNNIADPTDPILDGFEIMGKVFFKKADIIKDPRYLECYGSGHPELKNLAISSSHFAFKWNNKHKAWLSGNSPVFIDFGHDFLYWLKRRDQMLQPFWYIQVIKKSDFLSKYSL